MLFVFTSYGSWTMTVMFGIENKIRALKIKFCISKRNIGIKILVFQTRHQKLQKYKKCLYFNIFWILMCHWQSFGIFFVSLFSMPVSFSMTIFLMLIFCLMTVVFGFNFLSPLWHEGEGLRGGALRAWFTYSINCIPSRKSAVPSAKTNTLWTTLAPFSQQCHWQVHLKLLNHK